MPSTPAAPTVVTESGTLRSLHLHKWIQQCIEQNYETRNPSGADFSVLEPTLKKLHLHRVGVADIGLSQIGGHVYERRGSSTPSIAELEAEDRRHVCLELEVRYLEAGGRGHEDDFDAPEYAYSYQEWTPVLVHIIGLHPDANLDAVPEAFGGFAEEEEKEKRSAHVGPGSSAGESSSSAAEQQEEATAAASPSVSGSQLRARTGSVEEAAENLGQAGPFDAHVYFFGQPSHPITQRAATVRWRDTMQHIAKAAAKKQREIAAAKAAAAAAARGRRGMGSPGKVKKPGSSGGDADGQGDGGAETTGSDPPFVQPSGPKLAELCCEANGLGTVFRQRRCGGRSDLERLLSDLKSLLKSPITSQDAEGGGARAQRRRRKKPLSVLEMLEFPFDHDLPSDCDCSDDDARGERPRQYDVSVPGMGDPPLHVGCHWWRAKR